VSDSVPGFPLSPSNQQDGAAQALVVLMAFCQFIFGLAALTGGRLARDGVVGKHASNKKRGVHLQDLDTDSWAEWMVLAGNI
jgi:hypothetical protein